MQPRLPGMQDTYGEIMSGTQLLTIKQRTQPKVGAEDAKFLKKRKAAYKQQSPMMKMVQTFRCAIHSADARWHFGDPD